LAQEQFKQRQTAQASDYSLDINAAIAILFSENQRGTVDSVFVLVATSFFPDYSDMPPYEGWRG
jgi:hypothetical protein